MNERNIRLLLAYDGTDFCGWQRQDNGRTVQAELETALQAMHKHPVTVHAAGRTDSGVHASGQVVNFTSDVASIPEDKYTAALNSLLPRDVRVMGSLEAERDFHARFSASAREYRYYLYPAIPAPPHLARYCWAVNRTPDLGVLNRYAAALIGEVDFATFTAAGDTSSSTRRYVEAASFFIQGPWVVFRIRANAFLMKMVRSLVGTIVGLEKTGAGRNAMVDRIEARDRLQAGETAPARGLFLHEVYYHERRDY